MFIGFKLFKKEINAYPNNQFELLGIKNMHNKKVEIGKDPSYMDFKFNVKFSNLEHKCNSICEVQMMLQTILDCKDYLHTV